jgi:hypothetical protein
MNRLAVAATLALALGAPIAAHAVEWNSTGQWLDTHRHIVADDAHLGYAKAVCHAREGTWTGGPTGPGYGSCMKAQGFAFIVATPAQIAANRKAEQDARNIETLHAIGGALIEAGAAMQPHGCNGHVQPNGYFTTQCY